MATYYTKCGREFQKSTKAATTGYRMAEDDAECATCQYRESVTEGWPPVHKCWECRAGSLPPNHETEPQSTAIGCHTSLYVHTLDLSFIDKVKDFGRTLEGFGGAAYNQDAADCRKTISISFESNKRGDRCREAILRHFWPERFQDTEEQDELIIMTDLVGKEIKTHYGTGGIVTDVFVPINRGPFEGSGKWTINYTKNGRKSKNPCIINNITVKAGTILCEGIPLAIIERSTTDAEENQESSTEEGGRERSNRTEESLAPFEAEEAITTDETQPWANQADDSDTDCGDSEAGMMVGAKERCVAPESGCAAYCPHNGACAILITRGAALEQMIEMVPAGQCGFIDNYLGRNAAPVDALAPQSPTDLVPFDYSVLDDDTAIYLQDKAKLIAGIRIRSMLEIGRELTEVHAKLANHYQGSFGAWVESIGMTRQTANVYIQCHEYVVRNSDNIANADAIQPSLLMAMSRPSAPPELQEAVKAGEIQSITEWKERLREMHETNEALRKSNQELIRERTMTKRKVVDLESQVEQERTKPDRNRAAFEERIQDLRRQLATVQTQGSPDKVLQLEAEIAAKTREISMLQLEIKGRPIEAKVTQAPAVDVDSIRAKLLYDAMQPLLTGIGDMLMTDHDRIILARYYSNMPASERDDALSVLDLATEGLDDLSGKYAMAMEGPI